MSNQRVGQYESFHEKLRALGIPEKTVQIFADDQRPTPKEMERAREIAVERGLLDDRIP